MLIKLTKEEKLEKINLLNNGEVNEWNKWLSRCRPDKDFLGGFFMDLLLLEEVDLGKAKITGVDLKCALIYDSNLVDADLSSANLNRTKFRNVDLRGTNFTKADLTGADLTNVAVNASTTFTSAVVDRCKINRYTVECLSTASLTTGQRMDMEIIDDVAVLKNTYSGFLQWLHLLAVAGFLFPYLWFIGEQWGKARFLSAKAEDWIPLWEALTRFIFNGGVDWEAGYNFHYSFVIFSFSLVYTLLRICLLAKTKGLELKEKASGLPVKFNLSEKWWLNISWSTLYKLSQRGLWANLVVVALNLFHFSTMEIPLSL